MKASTFATILCIVLDITLIWHSFTEWDTLSAIGSAFGYTLLCVGLWIVINGLIKKGQEL